MKTRSGTITLPTGWPTIYEIRKYIQTLPMSQEELIASLNIIYQRYILYSVNNAKESRFGFIKVTETIFNYPMHHNCQIIQDTIDVSIGTLLRSENTEKLEKYINKLKLISNKHKLIAYNKKLESKKAYIKAIFERSYFGPDITSCILQFVN